MEREGIKVVYFTLHTTSLELALLHKQKLQEKQQGIIFCFVNSSSFLLL